MRQPIMIFRQPGNKLPTAKTLKMAGFHVSAAVAHEKKTQETTSTTKNAPYPNERTRGVEEES